MRTSTPVGPGAFSQLDRLHLSESERLRVSGYLYDGEILAELMLGALAGIRSGVELAERGIKALLPSHVKH
jgi:hypothetical protein